MKCLRENCNNSEYGRCKVSNCEFGYECKILDIIHDKEMELKRLNELYRNRDKNRR